MCCTGFLQSSDGAVLKPVLGPVKGHREVEFYQRVFSADCQDVALLDLRQFVAKFLGVWTTPQHPGCVYIHTVYNLAVSIVHTAAFQLLVLYPLHITTVLTVVTGCMAQQQFKCWGDLGAEGTKA